jgi:inhibitor of cysteine peptidase
MFKSIILLIIFLITTCGQNQKMLILKKENAGQQIEVKFQQEFQIELDANPTTGYTWTVIDTRPSIKSSLQSSIFRKSSDLIGAPGKQTFDFKANFSGKVELKLMYHRQWEKNIAPVDTFSVIIEVKKQ